MGTGAECGTLQLQSRTVDTSDAAVRHKRGGRPHTEARKGTSQLMKTNLFATLKRMVRCASGSSMLQTTAAIGAASIVAGTSTVAISKLLDQAKINRTRDEVKSVATVLNLLINDLGKNCVPRSDSDGTPLTLMVSGGLTPPDDGGGGQWRLDAGSSEVGVIDDYLFTNKVGFTVKKSAMQERGWDGPYLDKTLEADPWGNRYAISIGLYGKHRPGVAMVVSAGPDGVLSIPYGLEHADLTKTYGDDIYHCVE